MLTTAFVLLVLELLDTSIKTLIKEDVAERIGYGIQIPVYGIACYGIWIHL